MTDRDKIIQELLGKTVHVKIDRPIGYQHGDIIYPVNYGYIPGLLAGDGEEQDAYVLGVDTPLASFDGWVVGAVRRRDDAEDKLVVAPEGTVFHQGQIAEAVRFQEKYFQTDIVSVLRRSCGVLPYRKVGRQKEYLIVFEQFSQCWSLPKGHMEAGETEPETARRELFEETGLTAKLDVSHWAVNEYSISPAVRKQVVFFPGEVEGSPVVRPGEIERFKWVTKEELSQYLFPDTVEALSDLLKESEK